MSVTLRTARADEVALVAGVLNEAAAWLEARGEPLWQANELATSTLAPEVSSGLYVLAFSENEPIGVLRFTLEDPLFLGGASPARVASIENDDVE